MINRPCAVLLPLLALVMLTTGCSFLAAPEPQSSTEPPAREATIELLDAVTREAVTDEAATGDVWQVAVRHPSPVPPEECAEDAAVDVAVMTADLPASAVGYTLIAGSTESDAMRVATCIQQGIESGEITVTPPSAG